MHHLEPEELLASLNEQQRCAAAHLDGPLLVLAGPGSGKTRVITHRIAHLIAQGRASHRIAALTFTNKAAEEMTRRLQQLAPGNRVWTGTFHRFCSRFLRQHAALAGLKENFTIYDTADSKKVIKQAIEDAKVNLRHYSADKLAQQISHVKNNAVTVEQFQPRPGHALDAIVAQVYPQYQRLLQLANGVDFDDLLLYAVDILRQSPELRHSLDEHYQYMLVDEYQDTNLAQYQLIRLLNHTVQNLAVTGDPDQSIYGWRGANINNILQFERDYAGVTVVRLEQNYRSTAAILRVADQLIQNNTQRKAKRLTTENPEGEPVRLICYPSPQDEANDIADTISLAVNRRQAAASDFCILYRTNYLSRALEHALRRAGLPYQIVNGHEFYQRKEIKDLLAYLRLLNNPADNVALERVINTPARKIGKVTLNRLRQHAVEQGVPLLEAARNVDAIEAITKGPAGKIEQFVALIDRLQHHPQDEVKPLLETILYETDYRDWLTLDGSEEAFERAGNVDELLVAAEEFDREHAEEGGLEAYLEQASLFADTDAWESQADYVTLMTLHAAKGLEFPEVFIVGLEDGILPHERSSNDDNEVEEERRLLFVGITRAQNRLQISRCQNRFRRGSYWPAIASRFLMELPREEMQVSEPRGPGFGHDELVDAISQLSPWDDDLPSIDIRESGSEVAAEPPESPEAAAPESDALAEMRQRLAMLTSAPGETANRHRPAAGDPPGNRNHGQSAGRRRLSAEDYRVGMRVEHEEYGPGTIVNISGLGQKRTAEIDFPGASSRRFRLAYAVLEVLSDESGTGSPSSAR